MKRLKKFGKIIALDTLAILCFIGVILFGWLPGPGGIPLFLAGLGLLAINHDWAERLLEQVKVKGVSLKRTLFPKNRRVRLAYDVFSILFAIIATYILFTTDHKLLLSVSFIIFVFSLFILLVNRDRFDKFSNIFKNKA